MGKKAKSKARLDKYYYLSKEMGYRSRAAFKLIQLNKKYNFLSGATVLIDLCAAPGGWCQVAAKEMPISSIKIGIDLDPIKPIPGVTTFQCDITTEQCRHLIRKEIKHLKADVVLHDGAPNVGGQWAKDSYNQNELVLYSIKLASEFLKEGGWFISKVFRSVDYNALLYVMKQLFTKVEATKPLASRTQAAEIFVICQGYKNPSYIDPKLLDPKYALQQIDDEETMKNNTINSIKAMFERKKNRSGYNTDTLYIVKSFKDYIECSNPFKFLFETNKIKIQTEDCKKYLELVKKNPKDYELYFDDLQVLGRKEIEELIIWRNKIRTKLNISRKENKDKEDEKEDKDKKDKEKDINEEMELEIQKYEKQRKKRLEAQKRKQEKIELSNKKAFILQGDQPYDNDVENDDELYEYMQKHDIDIENLEEPKEEEEEEEEKEEKEEKEKDVNLSDLSEDDYIDMMNEDIEENKRLYEEEKEIKKINKEKAEKKRKKGEIEFVKNDNKDNDDIDDDNNLNDNEDDDEEDEENEGDDSAFYDEEDENEEEDNDIENNKDMPLEEDELNDDVIINNPLRKTKKLKEDKKESNKKQEEKKEDESNEEDNLSYDTDENNENNKKPEIQEEKKDNNKNFLNKKTTRENNKSESSSSDSENDGYNSDEKAEIRAIAKKMLRKKERLKILNSSYNRYAFEDEGNVPKWFLEDEEKHNKPQKPITKAEVLAEKEYLRKITVRMPKKILEAKARKKNRLNKRLQKIRKQAEGIANQDEYTEISKVKQIEKLYKREINKSKDKKRYIISRSWSNNKGKDNRNVRHVDRRMKKDKRAVKAREKRNKKYKRRR